MSCFSKSRNNVVDIYGRSCTGGTWLPWPNPWIRHWCDVHYPQCGICESRFSKLDPFKPRARLNIYRSERLFDLNVVELRLKIQRKRIAFTWHLSYGELTSFDAMLMNTTTGPNNRRRHQSEHGCPLNPPSCLPNTVIRPFIPSHTHTHLSSKYWFIDFLYQIPVRYRWRNDSYLNSNVINRNVDIKKQYTVSA